MQEDSFKKVVYHTNQKDFQIASLFNDPSVIEAWKNSDWDRVIGWLGKVDIGALNFSNVNLTDISGDNAVQTFEYVIAVFIAEFAHGL